MESEDFEKNLKEQIKQINDIPLSVEQKIKKAYQKIEMEEKGMKKIKLSTIIGIVASSVAAIVVVTGGIVINSRNNKTIAEENNVEQQNQIVASTKTVTLSNTERASMNKKIENLDKLIYPLWNVVNLGSEEIPYGENLISSAENKFKFAWQAMAYDSTYAKYKEGINANGEAETGALAFNEKAFKEFYYKIYNEEFDGAKLLKSELDSNKKLVIKDGKIYWYIVTNWGEPDPTLEVDRLILNEESKLYTLKINCEATNFNMKLNIEYQKDDNENYILKAIRITSKSQKETSKEDEKENTLTNEGKTNINEKLKNLIYPLWNVIDRPDTEVQYGKNILSGVEEKFRFAWRAIYKDSTYDRYKDHYNAEGELVTGALSVETETFKEYYKKMYGENLDETELLKTKTGSEITIKNGKIYWSVVTNWSNEEPTLEVDSMNYDKNNNTYILIANYKVEYDAEAGLRGPLDNCKLTIKYQKDDNQNYTLKSIEAIK